MSAPRLTWQQRRHRSEKAEPDDVGDKSASEATQEASIPRLPKPETPRERFIQEYLKAAAYEVYNDMTPLRRVVKPRRNSFWNDNEADPDLITDEAGEDDFEEDDMLSMAHAKLEEHREWRHYARVTAWEMPLLKKLAKDFRPPSNDRVLRFRYTSYMGEFHPAEKKVVVEFCPKDLDLTEVQQQKLIKLAGAHYNPEREIIKISCEMYEHQAQNKRYLGELIERLIQAAQDPTDTYEDIPLDTRHHKVKPKFSFPREWRMTEVRRNQLRELWRQSTEADELRRSQGTLIDGAEAIKKELEPPPPPPPVKTVEEIGQFVQLRPSAWAKMSARR